jgi:hypothetical protein
LNGKNSSILEIPDIFIFWVISTAVVLQGVIISLLGPAKRPSMLSVKICSASPKSHFKASSSLVVSSLPVETAITVFLIGSEE